MYDSYFFWFLTPLAPTLYFHVFYSPTEMGETEAPPFILTGIVLSNLIPEHIPLDLHFNFEQRDSEF